MFFKRVGRTDREKRPISAFFDHGIDSSSADVL